jgi:CheY-like chemotaxis protein
LQKLAYAFCGAGFSLRRALARLLALREFPQLSTPVGGQVPVAILTSSQLVEDRERALKLGAGAFLEKPGSLSGLKVLAREFESLANNLHKSEGWR